MSVVTSPLEISKNEKSELLKKVVELLLAKERKGWNEDEMKKEVFEQMAVRFGLTFSSIRNTYYHKVVPMFNEENEKKNPRSASLTLVKKEETGQNETSIEEKQKDKTGLKNIKVEVITDTKKTLPPVSKTSMPPVPKPRELDSMGRPLRPPYKINDIIEVKVDHIKEYGVFCVTMDEYEYKGLLHISEIKDIFISDANDYFEIGEIIKAKVILCQPERLNFSTRDMKIQIKKKKEDTIVADTVPKNPPINSIGEQFGKQLQSKLTTYAGNKPNPSLIKDEIEEMLKEEGAQNLDREEIEALFAEQIKQEEEQERQEQAKAQTQLSTQTVAEIIPTNVSERDIADAQTYLNNKIGALSPNAQYKLIQILEKRGMFKSTMAIGKVSDNFVVDYGLIFLEMVDRELEKDECL